MLIVYPDVLNKHGANSELSAWDNPFCYISCFASVWHIHLFSVKLELNYNLFGLCECDISKVRQCAVTDCSAVAAVDASDMFAITQCQKQRLSNELKEAVVIGQWDVMAWADFYPSCRKCPPWAFTASLHLSHKWGAFIRSVSNASRLFEDAKHFRLGWWIYLFIALNIYERLQ